MSSLLSTRFFPRSTPDGERRDVSPRSSRSATDSSVKRRVRQRQLELTPRLARPSFLRPSQSLKTSLCLPKPDVCAHTTTMTDAVQAPPSPRDSDADPSSKPTALRDIDGAEGPGAQKDTKDAPSFDVKALTDGTLQFLATASNETLGACLVGLGAGTYLILGRVGLVLIGVVGGVVLHATWEGHGEHGSGQEGKSSDTRRRELGVDVAHRVLDWRDAQTRTQEKGTRDDDNSNLSLRLYSGKPLDYSEFKPETAAALTELTDAVIRDYVKYVLYALGAMACL
jgi:hypothetical protein